MKRFVLLIAMVMIIVPARAADPGGGGTSNPILQKWLGSVRKWEDLPHASLLLSGDVHLRRSSMNVMLRLWDETHALPPKGIPGLDELLKDDLISSLAGLLPELSPPARRSALDFVTALAGNRAQLAPFLLAALAADDPAIRAHAKKPADELFVPETQDPRVVAAIVRALTQEDDRLSATANARLAAMGPAAKRLAIDFALVQLVLGNTRAKSLLTSWSADQTPLARAILGLGEMPIEHSRALAGLIEPRIDAAQAQSRACELLTTDDELLRQEAATIITAAGAARFDRLALLQATIRTGKALSPEVLKRLDLDPAIVSPAIAELLQIQRAPVRLAALAALKVTGLKGDAIRTALEPLLDDADIPVRVAAAELLGRTDVIARVRVPGLLKDLRSDAADRRMIAARQLDELGVEPREITTALVRAVDRRDMPAREGLISALEAAHAQRKNTLEILNQTAAQQSDLTSRAYARAALREIAADR